MAAVSICSDSGGPQNTVCHCFHCFPIYFPWSIGNRCHELSFLNVEFWNWKYIILLQRRGNKNILHHTATFWAVIDADLVKVSSKCPCTVVRRLFTQELHSCPLWSNRLNPLSLHCSSVSPLPPPGYLLDLSALTFGIQTHFPMWVADAKFQVSERERLLETLLSASDDMMMIWW